MTYLHRLAEGIARPSTTSGAPPAQASPSAPVDPLPDRAGTGDVPSSPSIAGETSDGDGAPVDGSTPRAADRAAARQRTTTALHDDVVPPEPAAGRRDGDADAVQHFDDGSEAAGRHTDGDPGVSEGSRASLSLPGNPRDGRDAGGQRPARAPGRRDEEGAEVGAASRLRAEAEPPARAAPVAEPPARAAPVAEPPAPAAEPTGPPVAPAPLAGDDRVAALLADLAAAGDHEDTRVAPERPREQAPPRDAVPTPTAARGGDVPTAPVLHIGTIDVVVEAPPARSDAGAGPPAPPTASSVMARLHLGRA